MVDRAQLDIAGLVVESGEFRLGAVDLTLEPGRYAMLMGPSGAGKTTLLEALCGLRRVTAGRIAIAGRDVTHQRPGERGIGYVPQDGALFPGMTVREHLSFALSIRRHRKTEIAERVERLAARVGVTALLDRRPQGLSGGERQRVALGRAIAVRPSLLLLDEPLSALDDDARESLYGCLAELNRHDGLTVLHVTHRRDEAERLAGLCFEMRNGRVTPDSD